MSDFNKDDVVFDSRSINIMRLRILDIESKNVKDKKNDSDVIKEIMRVIEEETPCC